MGVDIQIYPERRLGDRWLSICGPFRPGRNREIFQLVGLARGLPGKPAVLPLYPIRGLPDSLGYEAERDVSIMIDGDWQVDRMITRVEAELMVAKGRTVWRDENKYRILDTDFFGHSWLTMEEYDHVLRSTSEECDTDWWGLHALLNEFERRENETRIVMWFND